MGNAHYLVVTPLLAGLLLASGCAVPAGQPAARGGGQQITTQMSEFKFEPATSTVRQGQSVTVTLRNTGSVQHDWVVQELNASSPKVQPGQTGRVEFTPTRAGTFKIVCTEPGHEQGGMVGQLVVQ